MKQLKLFSLLLLLPLCFSCGRKEKEATAVATEFLNAYFATDYRKAAQSCTKEFGKLLLESVEDLDSQSETYRESLTKAASTITTEIQSVEEREDKTFVVHYLINMPDTPPIESILTLCQEDDCLKINGK